MKQPTSKQPNPRKFNHNNRCLIPFHRSVVVQKNKKITSFVTDRNPGQLVKSNDGKFTYEVQQNGSLVKIANIQ